MSLRFNIARAANKTGNLLQQLVETYLEAEGFTQNVDALVCYGAGNSNSNVPTLNANCSKHNKLEQAELLWQALGNQALMSTTNPDEAEEYLNRGLGALFARTLVHTKGKDIKPVLEAWQVRPLMAAGSQFFTNHVPSVREFRTWIYRKRHLGTYEKKLTRPEDCKKLGRNYQNGFDFSGIDHDAVDSALIDVSRRAIKALNLDFGAVDVLQKADGNYVVLEVNSAPGASHERRKCILNLAERIGKWYMSGCPERSGGG